MSLCISIKCPEGIVLATESRRVVMESDEAEIGTRYEVHDDAVKCFTFPAPHDAIGVTIYGNCLSPTATGAEDLAELTAALPPERCSIATVARLVAAHYTNRARSWPGDRYRMLAFVGGFDAGESTGRLYTADPPGFPAVAEALPGVYGMIWGGQRAIVDRIIAGYDQNLRDALEGQEEYPLQLPFGRLSLADCASLATTLVASTVLLQRFTTSLNACGGTAHVVTISAAGMERSAYPMRRGDGTYTAEAPLSRPVIPASILQPASYAVPLRAIDDDGPER